VKDSDSDFDFDVWEWEMRMSDPEPAVPVLIPTVDLRPVLAVWSAATAGVIVLSICVGLFWFGGAM